jgi:uncharacterized protein with HEPN domain
MNLEKDRVYAAHILECINKINHYTKKDKQQFIDDDLVQDGVLRRLQTMAESTQRLSDELKQTAPDVDWRALSGFRNVLVHDYLNGIDLDRIWDVVDNYLPALKKAVEDMVSQFLEL